MGVGMATINTVLKSKEHGQTGTYTKLCKIKSYPQLGGAPENLETTDLEDTAQTFCPGVQSVDSMEFGANYTKTDFTTVKAAAGVERDYRLEFGESGADGIYEWTGKHDVYINSGDVNAVREMTIVVTPSSIVTAASA